MAYLVLVYARDAEAAGRVYAANHPDDETPHRAVGIYEFPSRSDDTQAPDCAGLHNAWTRDQKKGFMTCRCGGRHPRWRSRLVGAMLDYLGYNLMPRAKTPRLFQNPETHNPVPLKQTK